MASKIIQRIQDSAEKLYEIRQRIYQKEEESKKELEALKMERDAVQAVLLAEMNKNGLSSMKVRSGDSFTRSVRKSIEIVSEMGALKWALENHAVTVNKILVAQKLKDTKEVPNCFDIVETEYISVRKGKSEE